MAGDALGGATVAAGAATAAGKTASKLEQDIAAIKAANATKLDTQLGKTQQELAKQLNNFYRDGAPPEQMQRILNQAAVSSTHNAEASEVVLGRFIAGSPSSYDEVAKARGATYFSMSDWNTVQGQLGADQMWNINKAFLDQQIAQGKSFVFTADPRAVKPDSFTALEFKHLTDNGFKLEISGGMYSAIKK